MSVFTRTQWRMTVIGESRASIHGLPASIVRTSSSQASSSAQEYKLVQYVTSGTRRAGDLYDPPMVVHVDGSKPVGTCFSLRQYAQMQYICLIYNIYSTALSFKRDIKCIIHAFF